MTFPFILLTSSVNLPHLHVYYEVDKDGCIFSDQTLGSTDLAQHQTLYQFYI